MRIAVDAMGGDYAPERPVKAALEALNEFPSISKLFLVGDRDKILEELKKNHASPDNPRLEIRHCTEVILMSDGAVEGIRRKKDNSISRSIELVKDGQADAVVSAGHTGAMVAGTTIKLRTLPGIDRPGIATMMPTSDHHFVLLDAGANIDAHPNHLIQYAVMGTVFSEQILKYQKPRVGLLSIGTEDVKGNDLTKETFKQLKKAPINFVGNIEGHTLFDSPVEVVVCDGFIGNVVLKTGESVARAVFKWLKEELYKTPFRKLGAWLARNAFRAILKKVNYEEYGGSLLLGVNGIAIIAHGSSSVKAIRNAIRVATESIKFELNPHIIKRVAETEKALAEGTQLETVANEIK